MVKPVWTSVVASAPSAGRAFLSLPHVTCIKGAVPFVWLDASGALLEGWRRMR